MDTFAPSSAATTSLLEGANEVVAGLNATVNSSTMAMVALVIGFAFIVGLIVLIVKSPMRVAKRI